MSDTESEWLTRKEAARYLTSLGYSLSPDYLSNLAAHSNAKGGPPYRRYGWKTVRYRKDDLKIWAEKRMVNIT